ncbi:phospholipase D-like domain-containing protein [Rhizobium sp. SSA_523]|uniref:phospholipase D-like domain-containing protein n=1 Tax=Rhizobium sp. SSA_523 TaxID=2952477 RepID=UPI002091A402|nr:phospholipase D-like domain-containing protein [Rhizobium sp. SSA_523]MCO5734522.1 phospholipase D-like domain-containing protein [Rhizobium sp. SSA_523]WKC23236.1 phospholipase D-like domain-containing protein [Rhizobium sp. SSA_523]
MLDLLSSYWPHIVFVLSVVMGATAAIHVAMTKEEVRSAVGWVGVILLSPIVGALLYFVAGINRIRRTVVFNQRQLKQKPFNAHAISFDASDDRVAGEFGRRFLAMKTLGDRVSRWNITSGNRIDMLNGGDAAFGAMLQAIREARRSILLETYIFDRDKIGRRFAEALSQAVARGVEVRVLIDAVGARYSVPSVLGMLRDGGVQVAVFNGNVIMGLRLPYANLRTHRKIMIVDGALAFTGGMNIREAFSQEIAGETCSIDTHFRLEGPVVADLFAVAAEDWQFASNELLTGEAWQIGDQQGEAGAPMLARVVASGPDRSLETNHKLLMGAFSVARSTIQIVSPYFLPDRELISALATAARRGVAVDIIVPASNNLTLVDRAMTAQFDQILKGDCRIWRASGPFNHSKLTVVDGRWVYVGSSNMDPRSLRLNFEVDVEIYDIPFAATIETRLSQIRSTAEEVKLEALRARPFPVRLFERVLWLGSPYL